MASYDPLLYALVHTGTPGDLGFYRRQCAGAERVLELGCGYGRLVAELAGAGHEVVGLDRDVGLLELAESRLDSLRAEVADRITLTQGDMRAFALGEAFDRIVIPHSGLYCLLTEADVEACLRCVALHLAPGGRLVLDAYAADGFHEECLPEDYPEDQLDEVALIALDRVVYDVYERSVWDRDAQRMVATYVHVPDRGGRAIEYAIEQRYLLRGQLETLLERVGLTPLSIHGDFEGGDYDAESDLIAVVAERPVS